MNIKELLANYGFEVVKIDEPSSGYRNKSYPIFLKNNEIINLVIYKKEHGIRRKIQNANIFGNELAKLGFAARKTLLEELIIINHQNTKRYACLYNYLPGKTIPWEAYTSKHIKLLGESMGNMHRLLSKYNINNTKFENIINHQIKKLDEMENYFHDINVKNAISKKLSFELILDFAKYKKLFDSLKSENFQLIHMDFVRSNILFSRKDSVEITGIIDFEKCGYGPRILDIARTLSFLLVDSKYILPSKVYKYFLFNGYQKRSSNKLPDLSSLQDLVEFFLIYDFYKFLKYNPYEFLYLNEHFLRTCKFLHLYMIIADYQS